VKLPSGLAFEKTGKESQVVPVQPAPDTFFDDPLPDINPGFSTFAERFRLICDLLDNGPAKSAAIRIAALKRILGYDNTSLRDGARKLHCSPSTLHLAVNAILKGMKSNSF
jgi:hypothetical protein